MASSDKLPSDLTRELGVPRNRLYKWKEQLTMRGESALPGSGRRSGSQEEVSRLRKELEKVKEERDIL
jgi:transposase